MEYVHKCVNRVTYRVSGVTYMVNRVTYRVNGLTYIKLNVLSTFVFYKIGPNIDVYFITHLSLHTLH